MTHTQNHASHQANRRFDVLAVSDMCVDFILYGDVRPRFHQIEQIIDNYVLEVGGSANIFASQLARLGLKSGVIGCVGKDSFGDFLTSKLNRIGVDTSYVQQHPTTRTGVGLALVEQHDRAILTYPGTLDATMPADLTPKLASETRHWHIASYFLLNSLKPFWKDWLSCCKSAGVTTSLDTNWDPADRWEGVLELLPLIDIFLPNEEEALRLTGERDCRAAAESLGRSGTLIVVKRGREGAIARNGHRTWEYKPETAVPTIADTIGAGDNFDAGFICAQMLGWTVEASLRLAHACAASSLSQPGGIDGQLCGISLT